MTTPSMLDVALDALANGLAVVPPAQDGTKRPDAAWKEYTRRLPTDDEVRAWYANGRTGLGLITGAVSGNLEMLEFEGRAVDDNLLEQFQTLADAADLGDLVARIIAGYSEASPSGGIHLLYRVDGPVAGNMKLARRPGPERNIVDVLIETRGEGGYVITAPSHGLVHPTGNEWALLNGGFDTIATITGQERDELHRVARALDQIPPPAARPDPGPYTGVGGTRPGDDYNGAADAAERTLRHLTDRGWVEVFQRGNDVHLRRPGKETGTSAVLHMDGGVFVVFTTSTEFQTEEGYTPFGVYAVLEHGGDHSAAAKALRPSHVKAATASGGEDVWGDVPPPDDDPDAPPAIAEGETRSTWAPVDLAALRRGDAPPPPTILRRVDDQALLYAGKVNSIYGESESMKSWLLLVAAAQQLLVAAHVLWVDFEDDAVTVDLRLQQLGIPVELIDRYFHYVRPDEPLRDHAGKISPGLADFQDAARAWPHTLAVLDGVTEALGLHGYKTNDGDDIAAFNRLVPRYLADLGFAVGTVDHVTKDRETRGKYAIGSQHKRAATSGAGLAVDMIENFGLGQHGVARITIAKDKPGHLRRAAAGKTIAELHLDSDPHTGHITWELQAPASANADNSGWEGPTQCMAAIVDMFGAVGGEMSKNRVRDELRDRGRSYRNEIIGRACEQLASDGVLRVRPGPRNSKLFTLAAAAPAELLDGVA